MLGSEGFDFVFQPFYKSSQFGNFIIFPYLCTQVKYVRIIAKKTLVLFWKKHEDCEQQLKSWFDETASANWLSTKDIKINYPSASFLNDNRVVFNIKGNSYRLIVKINYKYKMVWIRFIGTHAQYNKVDAELI